jgi:hypothetical protein
VTGGEAGRLAALERTLVGAAARQAQRRRSRRRRVIAAFAVAAPLVLAAAGAVASTQGFFSGVDQQLSTLRDDRLVAHDTPSTRLFDALGALPRDQASRRSWLIAGRRVTGYTTPSGSFCFRFGPFTGGCIRPGELTPANPVAYTVDYGPKTFRVYGLAIDGVTAVSLRARGVTRRVLLVRNAVYIDDGSLGGLRPLTGTLIVHLRGGAVARMPIRASGGLRPTPEKVLPILPGAMPVGDTAA